MARAGRRWQIDTEFLLFPEQQHANNPNTCFTWFHPADTKRNRGEAFSVWQMIERMIRDHGIDRRRVFDIGLWRGRDDSRDACDLSRGVRGRRDYRRTTMAQ